MSEQVLSQYYNFRKKRILFILFLLLLLFIIIIYSLFSGSADIGLRDIYSLITGTGQAVSRQIIYNIRLPRIAGAFLAGMALSVSGAVIQSILRNPLASPFTLGISGASAFGAAFAIIVLGAGSSYAGSNDMAIINNPYVVTVSAFLWSLCSVAVIIVLSKYKGATPEIIILSGIIISSLFGAGISAMQYFSDNIQLASIVFWTFGDIGRASWNNCLIIAVVVSLVMVFFISQSWNYKALQSGDEYARSLGVNVSRVRLTGLVVASLVTAVVVSFYGIIAFVGLVVPHIVRRIIGGDEQFLIPASAIGGGTFLLFSDTLARTIISPVILPVGILTSFAGAPLFLFLLIKGMGKDYWT
ncbi:MAG TPA: iron ABC transporter permease [Bacteroidales bacterium]|jgi:iron complex transport system permease protein|nr:iron ABC transporter permease [Bacteroidales bacterium]HOS71159.1 iron ABC transporter permease [Bacteroidales bacterium]HQH23252.1 iron ABC transporter permease [Bacteroidales bacterium]HQJ80890.1 iron ABC transporter permease [Bacteroidales bacterium]